MSSAARADAYLTIPPDYAAGLGRVRWAHGCEAIERWNGTTLVLAEELKPLLEGVFSSPPVPPLAFVLNLLHLMRDGPDALSVGFDRLWRARTAARGAAVLARNTGLLIAELCRGLPPAAGPPAWADVALAFGRWRLSGEPDLVPPVEEPPLVRAEFERRVEARLGRLDDDTLLHWFTHGCPPSTAGEQLAEPVETLPARVARLIALARRRPRLVGAAALAATVDAALTIPPRRRSPDAVPQGGYCDVTTRGEPDRLLPGQFALEPDEFVRRFAERELLYFKREEPHTAEKPERLVVLDQGVRTWGGVRLALAAAALALMKKDAKRVGRVRLAATSTPDLVEVTGTDVGTVAAVLEAGDLTPHPGECLRRVIHDPDASDGLRDVIVLTHPRSLREHGVIKAMHGGRPHDRLFTLTVDERGEAELGEWTDGGPVPIRSFRVDLAAAEAAGVEGDPYPGHRAGPVTGWTGEVEPVGFPFRPGLVAEPMLFGFDADEEWLVVAGREGALHGLTLDGSAPEVLPRPFLNGVVLKQVDAILGVADGVVVCGRMKPTPGDSVPCPILPGVSTTVVASGPPVVDSSASWDPPALPAPPAAEAFVAAHYDRTTRRVAVHLLGPASHGVRWMAYPALNCVAVRTSSTQPGLEGCAVELGTREQFPGSGGTGDLTTRSQTAWSRARQDECPPQTLEVFTRWSPDAPSGGPYLYLADNTIHLKRTNPAWQPFEPKRDGKPLLGGATIHHAQLAGDVLALALSRACWRGLVLFRGPDGTGLGEMSDCPHTAAFTLSRSGRLLARRRGPREVVVSETANPGTSFAMTALAGLHNGLGIRLETDPFRLTIRVGGFEHVFHLDQSELRHCLASGRDRSPRTAQSLPNDPVLWYDPARFAHQGSVRCGPWWAVLDRLGQVLLYARDPDPVAAFLVRRERAAAWAAGGMFWGDAGLIGGPPTPDAGRKIGRAIQAAGGRP